MTYSWLRCYKSRGPATQLRHLRLEMFLSNACADLYFIQIFNMLLHNSINDAAEKPQIPLVRHEGFLEDFMEHCAVDQRCSRLTGRFYAVLQYRSTYAGERIGYDSGRYQLIWMQYQDVVRIVNGTLTTRRKRPNDVYVCLRVRRRFIPVAPEMNRPRGLGVVGLNNQNLVILR